MELISSLQNEKVKLARNLQLKSKIRRQERKLAVEGTRLIDDALDQGLRPHFVLVDPAQADARLVRKLTKMETQMFEVTAQIISHCCTTEHPQGIVAVFPLPMPRFPRRIERILIFDRLRDPGNVGTILRTAGAAGVQLVVFSPESADPYNPKTLRSGMGAHFRIPIVEGSWKEITNYCADLNTYLAAGDGDAVYDKVDWLAPWALVIGSEAHGISTDAEALDATRIRIPMAANTESLNAGVAAGVILFEAARQLRNR